MENLDIALTEFMQSQAEHAAAEQVWKAAQARAAVAETKVKEAEGKVRSAYRRLEHIYKIEKAPLQAN